MAERLLEKLKQQIEGRRKEWEPKTPTPKQIQDHINRQRSNDFEVLEAEYTPTPDDVTRKQEGLRRRRHSRR